LQLAREKCNGAEALAVAHAGFLRDYPDFETMLQLDEFRATEYSRVP